MDVAQALWDLADAFEAQKSVPQAVKCLEAICQSEVPFLPHIEVKTRIRVASLLLEHSRNVSQAKTHLERAQVLLQRVPRYMDLKCQVVSLLSECYHYAGNMSLQKQTLKRGIDLVAPSLDEEWAMLWACNFRLQFASLLLADCDHEAAVRELRVGQDLASRTSVPGLQVFFAVCTLQVLTVQGENVTLMAQAAAECDTAWTHVPQEQVAELNGLHVYDQICRCLYRLLVCDYKEAQEHAVAVDKALGISLEAETLLPRKYEEQLVLGPGPLSGQWLPMSAVMVLAHWMAVTTLRPSGRYKDCSRRLEAGLSCIDTELARFDVDSTTTEERLEHMSIYHVGRFLLLYIHLLEAKAALDLTRCEFLDAQQSIVRAMDIIWRYPTILQGSPGAVHLLAGQYAHSVESMDDAARHFLEAARLGGADSSGTPQTAAMASIYAALVHLCADTPEGNSEALDLLAPIQRELETYVGHREKAALLFLEGLLLNRQQGYSLDGRQKLASGLKLTHKHLMNHQLVSQYLLVLGRNARLMGDATQARDIFKSAHTLTRSMQDIPTQMGILREITEMHRTAGETEKVTDNEEVVRKKREELKRRIKAAEQSPHHLAILKYGGMIHDHDAKRERYS